MSCGSSHSSVQSDVVSPLPRQSPPLVKRGTFSGDFSAHSDTESTVWRLLGHSFETRCRVF